MLAQKNESDLIKLAIPIVPMVSDYCFSDPQEMTKTEREVAQSQRKIWKVIAEDFDKQRKDPLLFPNKAGDELLEKMPPTIIWENEFDMYLTEATRMAMRLRAAGRLLEFVIMPGLKHESGLFPGESNVKTMTAFKLALDEYLFK